MRKKGLFFVFLSLLSLSLVGCEKEKSKDEDTYISVTESVDTNDENYVIIDSVRGYNFAVRKSDFEGDFEYNTQDILNENKEIPYFVLGDDDYEFDNISLDNKELIKNDNMFLLHSFKEYFYYLRTDSALGVSAYYFDNNDVVMEFIRNQFSDFGLTDFYIDEKSVHHSVNEDTGEILYSADVTFVLNLEYAGDYRWNGILCVWENGSGQSVFLVGGYGDYISGGELSYIKSSITRADSFNSFLNDYGTSELSIDYGGFKLNGTFNDALGLCEDLESYRFSNTLTYFEGDSVPFFANPYSPFLLRYGVYNLAYPMDSKVFAEYVSSEAGIFSCPLNEYGSVMYNNVLITHYLDESYSFTDSSGVVWDVYTANVFEEYDRFAVIFDCLTMYVRMDGNNCICIQTLSTKENKDFYANAMKEGLQSSYVTEGNSALMFPIEDMTKRYESYLKQHPEIAPTPEPEVPVATNTDAVIVDDSGSIAPTSEETTEEVGVNE